MRFPTLRFYEADDAASGGTATDPTAGLQAALARHKQDAMALAATLYSENYQLREKNRALAAAQPGEGAVVLTKEQAAAWQAYQQLGEPAALKTITEEHGTLKSELTGLKRDESLRSVADVAKMKASVLKALAGEHELSVIEQTVDGKTVKQAVIKTAADAAPVTLSAYAEQHWADFLPALKADATQPAPTPRTPTQPAPGGAPSDPVQALAQQFQAQRDKAFNPLRPAAPPTVE